MEPPASEVLQALATIGGTQPKIAGMMVADSSCANKRRCGDMSTCEEAQFYLKQCRVRRLDGDGDGVPCETLCNYFEGVR